MLDTSAPSALGTVPFDIILEIAKYLDLPEILSLKSTAKFLYEFTLQRSFWLVVAQNITFQQPLPILQGRFLPDCSVQELEEAFVKASKLHKILRENQENCVVHPKGTVGTLKVVESNEDFIDLFLLLPYGGRYLGCIINQRLTCWDITTSVMRPIAEIPVGDFGRINMTLVSNSQRRESLLLGYWHSVTWPSVQGAFPTDGIFTLVELNNSERQSPPIFVEIFSTPVAMAVTNIFIDECFIAVAGLLVETWTACVLLIVYDTMETMMLDTQISLPIGTVLKVFISDSQLVLYHEYESSSQLFSYELDILEGMIHGKTLPLVTCALSPRVRLVPLDASSQVPSNALLKDSKASQNMLGTGRGPHDCFTAFTMLRHNREEDVWIISCHILDHLFDSSSMERHRQSHTVSGEDLAPSMFLERVIWLLDGPYAAYIKVGANDQRLLVLVTFPRDNRSENAAVESIVSLPDVVDLDLLCDIDFDSSWGILVLSMADSHVHIINLA